MRVRERILVIRLGALGDLVLCFQAFHEIRRAHPAAEIALLTMPGFVDFAKAMPWFDRVIADERQTGFNDWLNLCRRVRNFAPKRVYDLQGKFRQTVLFGLLGGPLGVEWSGAAPLCSYPRLWPPQAGMHFMDFVAAQLRLAHIPSKPPADLGWLDASLDGFILPEQYVLFIPGCTPGREYKRWPAKSYADIANRLRARNIGCFTVGTKLDADAINAIRAAAPAVTNLAGQTSLLELAGLARRSMAVIGNDTGPTHLAAAVGANVIALMSHKVNPVWSAPRGSKAHWIQGAPLEELGVDEVYKLLVDRL